MSETTRIIQEIIRIGSRAVEESDVLAQSKYSSALAVLSSAMSLSSTDMSKAKRLLNLANSISK